jgi:hypothetical protein
MKNTLVLLFSIVLVLAVPGAVKKSVPDSSSSVKAAPHDDGKLMVYYFRNNKRCPSCFKIENYSKAAVEEGFAADVRNGRMEWRMINVQDAGNEFYVEKYQIFTKTVILSLQKEGKEVKWKNLDQIWDLLYDENIFKNYIKQGIRAFLAEK